MAKTLSILDFKSFVVLSIPFIVFFVCNGFIKKEFQNPYTPKNSKIVLLGNSILGRGISADLLEQEWQISVQKIAQNGSASAYWFLMLKNFILQNPPKTIILFFRDHYLTHPRFRTTGRYRTAISQIATDTEPLLTKLVLQYDPIYYSLPGYVNRERYQYFIFQSLVPKIVTTMTNVDARQALKKTFDLNNLQKLPQTKQQQKLETEKNSDILHFTKNIHLSFLPEIIEQTKKHQVQLILVRAKRRNSHPNMKSYITNLKEYLRKKEILFLDYSQTSIIKEEHFADGDHLNLKGKRVFTKLLAQDLHWKIKQTQK
ncbi:hypothetical protein [Candidatus Uabimicrobium sp. HlEnr_7]|uniref:hypothetical protein n=1 Tax=Candidatus Uabimicrobium helgolandensis TaxID=3095367 RepID=UPI0035569A3E